MIVYRIRNKLDGKMYIGQTKYSLKKRWGEHCYQWSDCRYLSRAIKKHGKGGFEVSVLARCNSLEEMNHREAYYIKLFKTLAPNGYNLTTGGDNSKMSEETKKIISKNSKKMWANGKGVSRKGLKNSEESKLKVAAALKGHLVSEETREKMSLRRMGGTAWNKGQTKETNPSVKRTSEKLKGKPLTPECKQKLSDSHKGQKAWNEGIAMSEKSKKKMSNSKKGKKRVYLDSGKWKFE